MICVMFYQSNMDSSTQNSIETIESRDIELSSSNQQHIEFQNVENDTLADTISLPTENGMLINNSYLLKIINDNIL